MYTVIFVVLIVIILGLLLANADRERLRQQEIVESYITEIFAKESYRPEVTAGYTYGIPSFTLKFKSDKEKAHAISNGLTEQFIKKIQLLCNDLKPRGKTFDANRAVAIYSKTDEMRWQKKAVEHRKETKND